MTDPDDGFTAEPDEHRRWQRRFEVRRDGDPPRSGLLLALGILSIVVGVPSLYLVVPALIGLPLSLVAYLMADRDLLEMRAGHMDRRGRASAHAAQWCALVGFLLNALGLTVGCVALGAYIMTIPD
jgi:hypothetical protein